MRVSSNFVLFSGFKLKNFTQDYWEVATIIICWYCFSFKFVKYIIKTFVECVSKLLSDC